MPQALIGAAVAPIVGGIAGKIIGGGGPKNAQPALPRDLQGMRGNQIGLLNYLLGFGGQMPGQPGQPPASQGGPIQRPQQGQAQGGGNGWGSNPGAAFGLGGSGMGAMLGGVPGALLGGTGAGKAAGGAASGMAGIFGGGGNLTDMVQHFLRNQGGAGGMPAQGGPQGLSLSNQGMQGQPSGGFMRGQSPTGFDPAGQMPQGQANNPMLGRMESYFGPLGTPTTGLQQQSLGGMSQYLNSDPYGQSNQALQHIMGGSQFGGSNGMYGQAAQGFGDVKNANYFGNAQHQFQDVAGMNPFGAAQTSMEGILGANPGQGMLAALQPSFDRNMAAANQQGGRFGSANAILRSRAVDDYNLLGAQALQRGTDQQIAAAGQYGVLGNNLLNARLGAGQGMLGVGQGQLSQGLGAAQGLTGVAGGLGSNAANLMQGQLGAAGQMANNQNSMFGNMLGGYGAGSAQAGQEAQRQQQALQILLGQLGVSQQATLGAPTVVSPSGAQQGAQMGGDFGSILANYFANQQGGGKQRGNRTQGMG